jgi:hypothetical protein
MPALLETPRKAIWIRCDRCNGSGRMVTAWKIENGLPDALGPCVTCMSVGRVLSDAPSVGEPAGVRG